MNQLNTTDVANLRQMVAQRGLTREQAQQQFGLDDSTMGWIDRMGVDFHPGGPGAGMAPNGLMGAGSPPAMGLMQARVPAHTPGAMPPAPPPMGVGPKNVYTNPGGPARGLAFAAAQGQGGDTELAHVTPGETVVPREIMAGRPDVARAVDAAIAQTGADPMKYKVGVNPRYNPITGVQQFASDPSIQDWYRNVAGRDAQQPELDYWQQQADQLGGEQAFNNFISGLRANGEAIHTADYTAANTAFQGTQSDSGFSNVDDWARNVFGRPATADEIARFGNATTADQARSLYGQFVASGTAAGGTARNLSLTDASQLPGASSTVVPAPTPAPTPAPAGNGVITPVSVAPVPSYGTGTGLYDAMTVPDAFQANMPTVAPAVQASGASVGPAVTGVVSAPVTAGTGTSGAYNATTAAAAAPVVAGTAASTDATSQGYTATDAQASLRGDNVAGYDAAQWTPDAESTVQGQVAKIVASDSPLNDIARTESLQGMSRRGLANSSMAIEAGQAALYKAALPIAQQDANTFAQAGQYNTEAKNVASRFFAQAKNEAGAQDAQLQTGVNLANAGEKNKAGAFTASEANLTSRFNAQQSTEISKFNVSSALQAGIINQEQANKMAAIAAENINRAAEFNITTNAQMQQFNIDAALKAGIVNKQQADAMTQFNAAQQNTMAVQQAQLAQQNSQFNAGQANTMATALADLNAKTAMFNASQSNDLIKLGMDSQTKIALGSIEANYKTLMQSSSSASQVYTQAMNNITAILTNKDMDAAAKSTAINNLVGTLNGALGVIGGIANLDLPQLVFGNAPAPSPAPAPADGGGDVTAAPATQ
jgi:hypothetical protein